MSPLSCPISDGRAGRKWMLDHNDEARRNSRHLDIRASFVIRISSLYLNETDRVNEKVIFASLSFSRDETGIAARSRHVRRNNLQRNPPASAQSLCVAWQNIFRARLVRSKRQWGMLRFARRRTA